MMVYYIASVLFLLGDAQKVKARSGFVFTAYYVIFSRITSTSISVNPLH